ncbi:NUDIX domain-containing protein [Clostridiaceae bacterium M8S5]|nr:NUDIX domain-containing protein [Clostridiaceae bacterium M8S5]
MNDRARAIIIVNNKLALIKRVKSTESNEITYFVFPGGGVKENESSKECVVREVYEELGIIVEVIELYHTLSCEGYKEYFYICEHKSGEIGSGKGEEYSRNSKIYGCYIPQLINIKDISSKKLYPITIRDKIITDQLF